jgi:hypothetical protein
MTVGNPNPVASWVLEWERCACVVEPPELVEREKSELAEALARHQRPSRDKRRESRWPRD